MVHSPNSGNRVEVRHVPTRSQRFGDAFSDELLAANGITSGDAPVRAPVDGADSETDSEAGHSGRHYWDRSWG